MAVGMLMATSKNRQRQKKNRINAREHTEERRQTCKKTDEKDYRGSFSSAVISSTIARAQFLCRPISIIRWKRTKKKEQKFW